MIGGRALFVLRGCRPEFLQCNPFGGKLAADCGYVVDLDLLARGLLSGFRDPNRPTRPSSDGQPAPAQNSGNR